MVRLTMPKTIKMFWCYLTDNDFLSNIFLLSKKKIYLLPLLNIEKDQVKIKKTN